MTATWYWQKAHGFNDGTGGAENIDLNASTIVSAGHKNGITINVDCDSLDYGFWKLLWVRFRKHGPVMRMVIEIEKAIATGQTVILEGYSNGWNYLLKALFQVCDEYLVLAPGQRIYLIGVSPAGNTRPKIPQCVHSVRIYHSKSDWAVKFATWAARLRIVPEWGRLGAIGYKGDDPRVTSRDITDNAKGHGGGYREGVRDWLAHKQIKWVLSREAQNP